MLVFYIWNNKNNTQEEVRAKQPSPLHQVTPLSKYLAMALFIILPFVGGWIGYTYAPEEVEKEVTREALVKENESVTGDLENPVHIGAVEVQTYSAVLEEPNGYNPFLLDPENYPEVQNFPMKGIHVQQH